MKAFVETFDGADQKQLQTTKEFEALLKQNVIAENELGAFRPSASKRLLHDVLRSCGFEAVREGSFGRRTWAWRRKKGWPNHKPLFFQESTHVINKSATENVVAVIETTGPDKPTPTGKDIFEKIQKARINYCQQYAAAPTWLSIKHSTWAILNPGPTSFPEPTSWWGMKLTWYGESESQDFTVGGPEMVSSSPLPKKQKVEYYKNESGETVGAVYFDEKPELVPGQLVSINSNGVLVAADDCLTPIGIATGPNTFQSLPEIPTAKLPAPLVTTEPKPKKTVPPSQMKRKLAL